MVKCCMRNCYGAELDDLRNLLKLQLPRWLIDFLLDLSKCGKNGSQSQKNGLSNFNMLNLYAGKKIYDTLDELDRNGGYYDHNTPRNEFEKELTKIIEEFDRLICNGGGKDLSDVNDKYNSDNGGKNKFPSDLTDDEKDIIRDILDNNNGLNDNKGGGSNGNGGDGKDNILIGGSGNGNGSDYGGENGSGKGQDDDDYFSGDGSDKDHNPLVNVPDDVISNLDFDSKFFKCFVRKFDVNNYIVRDPVKYGILISPQRIKMLKRIHDEIMLPIFNYYFSDVVGDICSIKIHNGLTGIDDARLFATASPVSRHIRGEAVDITINGIDATKFIQDIQSGALVIPFGVITATNGIHITLPFTFRGYQVANMILTSPKQAKDSLEVQVI